MTDQILGWPVICQIFRWEWFISEGKVGTMWLTMGWVGAREELQGYAMNLVFHLQEHHFEMSQLGMRNRLKQLRALLNITDPQLYQFLSECSAR